MTAHPWQQRSCTKVEAEKKSLKGSLNTGAWLDLLGQLLDTHDKQDDQQPGQLRGLELVNFVGNFNHNSGIPDLTNGLTLAVVDEVENVTDILVEVGVTENILAKEGVTLVVVDKGEADTLDNLIEEEVESKPLEPA